MPRAAVVIDQTELFRLGLDSVLTDVDIRVVTSTSRVADGLQTAKSGVADLIIVGSTPDLKPQHLLREIKKSNPALFVVFLLDKAVSADISRLIGLGADGLLLRGCSAAELGAALDSIYLGERVVAPALSAGTIGRVGPATDLSVESAFEKSGLSPKELEVLGELASGLTYAEIASSLIVTQATVKTHLVHIYAKLEVKNRAEAVTRALALGLLS